MRVVVVLRRWLEEMMDQVRTGYGKQDEERQHCPERAETVQSLAPVPPPLLATCTTMAIHQHAIQKASLPA